MASVSSGVDELLCAAIPNMPQEIKHYVSALVCENRDEFRTGDDVHEAVGDIVEGACPAAGESVVRAMCDGIAELLHAGSAPVCATGGGNGEHRALHSAVHIGDSMADSRAVAAVHNGSAAGDLWSAEKRNDSQVDLKKLGRAEAKSREKMEKRTAVTLSGGPEVRKKQAVTATASCASRKTVADETNSAMVDIKFEQVDVSFGDRQLLSNAEFTLSVGRRYGLVGRNGIGKTTLLSMLSAGQLPVPLGVTVLHVEQEVTGDDTSVMQAVIDADVETKRLIEEESDIQETLKSSTEVSTVLSGRLSAVYAELAARDADKAPAIVAGILFGLGFSIDEQHRPTREFSGGWRMRIALAQALFLKPDLLLLDEPTNMLDMKAIYWLERHLQTWPSTILCVSHDRNFLNAVCTDVMHMHSARLESYRGDYDAFERSKEERLSQQHAEYEAQMELRKHTQAFIDKFRYNAKRASLVQSRIKMLDRLPVLQCVVREPAVLLRFPDDIEKLSGAVLQLDNVTYAYSPSSPPVFAGVDASVDSDSRVCIVGDNGAGKTTLLKLLMGDSVEPTGGFRNAHRRLKLGYFAQHHVDQLDMDISPLELIAKRFPGHGVEHYRASLGRFGVGSELATRSVATLSGGQKSRLAFALLAMLMPNMLIMDEPTNHLDIDTVEALAKALNQFKGGVVLVSHDERLIELVCSQLWLVGGAKVQRIDGGLAEYKKIVLRQLQDSAMQL